jgi:hypothetical protein
MGLNVSSAAAKRRARALRRWTMLGGLGALLALAGMYAMLAIPGYLDYTTGQGSGAEISIMKPWVSEALFWAAVSALVACLTLCGVACYLGARTADIQTRRMNSLSRGCGVSFGSPVVFWGATTALPGLCVLAFILACGVNGFGKVFSPDWRIVDRATASDGKEYALISFRFWLAHSRILARPEADTVYRSVYRVLGENDSEQPSWASLVRPADTASNPRKRIYFAPDGLVLATAGDNECVLAFNPHSGACWTDGFIEGLSPFVLLDENTEPYADDVAAIETQVRTAGLDDAGFPHRDVLVAGRTSSNSAVRELSAEWLRVATERAQSSQPRQRRFYP